MELSGEYRIEAPRERVWQALNDPDVLRQCIAGVESLERSADNEFTATVNARVGPVKVRFVGKVTLSDLDPPNGYTISGEGQGGVAGFAKGAAKVTLSDDGAATVLRYTANAQVGGKLAQIGSRMIAGVSKKMADQFFSKFVDVVAAAEAPAEASTDAPPAEPTPAPRPALTPIWWVAGAIAVVALLLWWWAG